MQPYLADHQTHAFPPDAQTVWSHQSLVTRFRPACAASATTAVHVSRAERSERFRAFRRVSLAYYSGNIKLLGSITDRNTFTFEFARVWHHQNSKVSTHKVLRLSAYRWARGTRRCSIRSPHSLCALLALMKVLNNSSFRTAGVLPFNFIDNWFAAKLQINYVD